MPQNLCVEVIAVHTGRTPAKELFRREELLMDFETGLKPESGVVAFGHFYEWFDVHGLEVVPEYFL